MVAPGIEPGTSGTVARNSDHYTTEAVNRVPSEPKTLLTYFSLTLLSSKVHVAVSSPECRAKSLM
jgi:hypothetical protein